MSKSEMSQQTQLFLNTHYGEEVERVSQMNASSVPTYDTSWISIEAYASSRRGKFIKGLEASIILSLLTVCFFFVVLCLYTHGQIMSIFYKEMKLLTVLWVCIAGILGFLVAIRDKKSVGVLGHIFPATQSEIEDFKKRMQKILLEEKKSIDTQKENAFTEINKKLYELNL